MSGTTRRMSWGIRSRGAAAATAVLLVAATAATAAPAPSEVGAAASAAPVTAGSAGTVTAGSAGTVAPGEYEVTLLTGDRVFVTQYPDGTQEADVDLADRGGGGVELEWLDTGEDLYVLPSDVRPYLHDQLDRELFNVTGLIRSGYHAAGTGYLPAIVTFQNRPGAAADVPLADAAPLSSIDGAAASFDRPAAEAFWRDAVVAPSAAGGSPDAALAGVERIWLDQPVAATLHDSVDLINAPEAWDAGFDGAGVTIAVLDTGVDRFHPDLAGEVVAVRNFTDELGSGDGHGHGTHVAATAAGTGAGSDGLRTGVAPGADLVSGKVLNSSGFGQTSWIINGMEWATQTAGADVVNMSLGGGVTDGTDPLSQAVDSLTADTGALFVIAAGNQGSRDQTISSPGAASAALTVGAVDKFQRLASFSSRGPRKGDFAIKPDLTAPGVDIVAARGTGTSMGEPVDDLYTQASGTSMAAPHAAGAAAILAQQRPDWEPAQLKAALVSTAVPRTGLTVYQQGGGRLDVANAVEATVLATPAPLDLGYYPFPHDPEEEPTVHEVTYTNLSAVQQITLSLSLELTDEDGAPPAPGMVTLGQDQLTLAPGGTASTTVTVDVEAGDIGLYGGYLSATAGALELHTPAGFYKEEERYDLTVQAIDTEGGPASGAVTVMNVANRNEFFELSVPYDPAGVAHVRVPPGPYAVYGLANTHPPGETFPTVWTAVAEPEIEVTAADVEVVFDARAAAPITVDAPAHDVAPRSRTTLEMFRDPEFGRGAIHGVQAFAEGTTFQALATDPVERGFFEFNSRWQLADPADPFGTPVLYDVVFPETGRIPPALEYVVHPEQLAASHQEFHIHAPGSPEQRVQEVRHWWRPWQTASLGIFEDVAAPGTRTDYLATADTTWTRVLWFAGPPASSLAARMHAPRMEYQPGEEETRTWMKQPVKPAGLIEGSPWHPSFPQVRDGDILDLFIPEFGDSQRGHWGWYHGSIDTAQLRVFEDGVLVAQAPRPRGEFSLSPGPSRVRLETEVGRTADWWTMSTHTSTAWEFGTERPAAGPEVVPMLLVDYELDLDLQNSAPPARRNDPQTIGLQVRHQPGATGPAIAGAQLWVSYDDGASWLPADGEDLGGGRFAFDVPTRVPKGAQFASLRVAAWDADDNRIEQEITRAWTLSDG